MLSVCPDCRRHVRDEPSCPFCGSVAPRTAAQGAANSHSARALSRTGRLTRAAFVAGALGLAGCDDPPPAPPSAGEPAPPDPAPPQPPPDYGAMEPAYGAPPEVAPPTPPDDPGARAPIYGGPPRAD